MDMTRTNQQKQFALLHDAWVSYHNRHTPTDRYLPLLRSAGIAHYTLMVDTVGLSSTLRPCGSGPSAWPLVKSAQEFGTNVWSDELPLDLGRPSHPNVVGPPNSTAYDPSPSSCSVGTSALSVISSRRTYPFKDLRKSSCEIFLAPPGRHIFTSFALNQTLTLAAVHHSAFHKHTLPSCRLPPAFCVPKPDGSLRLVIDYRYLNSHTIPDRFPLPLPEELLGRLHGAERFSSFDAHSGFTQQAMHPNSRYLTAFTTPMGLF
eukprot:gene47784-64094_t